MPRMLFAYDPDWPAARGTASYDAAKTPVTQEVVDRARDARGLPSVPVSDKG